MIRTIEELDLAVRRMSEMELRTLARSVYLAAYAQVDRNDVTKLTEDHERTDVDIRLMEALASVGLDAPVLAL